MALYISDYEQVWFLLQPLSLACRPVFSLHPHVTFPFSTCIPFLLRIQVLLNQVPILMTSYNLCCCCCLIAKSCLTLCGPTGCSTPGFPDLHYLLEFAQTHIHCVGDAIHLILCRPLLFLLSIFPSIRVFSNESALCIRWPKDFGASASASVLPMNIQD